MTAESATDIRDCPDCGQPQEWCTRQPCAWPFGHWTHITVDVARNCGNIGDRNRVPGAPPDNAYTRGELA